MYCVRIKTQGDGISRWCRKLISNRSICALAAHLASRVHGDEMWYSVRIDGWVKVHPYVGASQ